MPWYINYLESERGWGQKHFSGGIGWDTKKEAEEACEKELEEFIAEASDTAPNYYIRPDGVVWEDPDV
jgi:hypothetical protein